MHRTSCSWAGFLCGVSTGRHFRVSHIIPSSHCPLSGLSCGTWQCPPCRAQLPAPVLLTIQAFCRTLVPPQPLSFSSKLPTTSPKPLNLLTTGPAPRWLFHRTPTSLAFGPIVFNCRYLTQNTACGFAWDWLCFISGLLSSEAARSDSGAKSRVAGHQLVCPGWE